MTEHNFENKCPKCGSDEKLEYEAYEWVDKFVYQNVHCLICGKEFIIYSKPAWTVMRSK